jgi:hypothetical protein
MAVLTGGVAASDLTNIENVSSLNGGNINFTDDIDLNGNNLISPGKVDGINLSNPGTALQKNGDQLQVNTGAFVDRDGDTVTGDINLSGNNITEVNRINGQIAQNLGINNLSEVLTEGNKTGGTDIDLDDTNLTDTGKGNVTIGQDLKVYGQVFSTDDNTLFFENGTLWTFDGERLETNVSSIDSDYVLDVNAPGRFAGDNKYELNPSDGTVNIKGDVNATGTINLGQDVVATFINGTSFNSKT